MQDAVPNNHIEQSLFEEVISFDNLFFAAQRALMGKLTKPRFFAYYSRLGVNVANLHMAIKRGEYRPSLTKEFDLWCISGQKMRHINVPDINDLIVQHAIYRVFYPYISSKLIYDSYGCRKDKGTTKAADRCQYFVRHSQPNSYYLQLDIRKYYYNIDHAICKQIMIHLTGDQQFTDFVALQFPQDTTVGMYVGSLIAQVMGIIYLNPLDHYIKRVLKCRRYIRYVDDFVIIGETKERCQYLKNEIEKFIKEHLNLELSKYKITPISKDINFVGFRTWQNKRIIRKRSMKVFNKSLRERKQDSLQSCLGHALNTSSYSGMVKKAELNGCTVENGKINVQ